MFFSVKSPIKIGGKVFQPCICYEVTPYLEATVNKLKDEGRAEIHEDRVFFCNGKVVEKKPAVKEAVIAEKPRKEKKTKEIPAKEFVKEAEDVVLPSPEEIADNEDF